MPLLFVLNLCNETGKIQLKNRVTTACYVCAESASGILTFVVVSLFFLFGLARNLWSCNIWTD